MLGCENAVKFYRTSAVEYVLGRLAYQRMEESHEPHSESPEPQRMPWMVALFDVLGFSARLRSSGLEIVHRDYQTLVERVVTKEPLRCIGAMKSPGETGRVPAIYSADVRYTYFSDTILLWMPLVPLFVGPFTQRCADLVCEALRMGIPLRGALSLGEAVMHKKTGTYIGEPLVEAARLEAARIGLVLRLHHRRRGTDSWLNCLPLRSWSMRFP